MLLLSLFPFQDQLTAFAAALQVHLCPLIAQTLPKFHATRQVALWL